MYALGMRWSTPIASPLPMMRAAPSPSIVIGKRCEPPDVRALFGARLSNPIVKAG